jgi:N,N'-diacetyllegionaminate synthase
MKSGSRSFEIDGVAVGKDSRPYILAEIGINHGGDVLFAEKLIHAAAESGANGVKFQTFHADDLVSRSQSPQYWELFSKCELDRSAHEHLRGVARSVGLSFISTPFSFKDVDLLAEIGVPAIKIASGDLTNHPLLQYVGRLGLPVILSTGMSYLDEVREAREVLLSAGCSDLAILHCVSRYPTLPHELNLGAIKVLIGEFPEVIGFSDHTEGTWAVIAAVALGARFIEKHFTLDKRLPGPDHHLSAEPQELKTIVEAAINVFESLGLGIKEPTDQELKNRKLGRKGLYAARNIASGEKLAAADMKLLRPEGEIPASDMDIVVGRTATKNINEGDGLTWDVLGGRPAPA